MDTARMDTARMDTARMDTARHDGTVALVTGAASGIGRATAVRLAGEGATVVATDGNDLALNELAGEAPSIVTVAGDLLDTAFIDDLVAAAEGVGPVGVLANVAGIMDHFVPVTELDDDLWHKVLGVNLTAPMQLCRAMIPLMAGRGGGAIVNVASVAGLGGSGAGAAYVSSKHAVIGLTKNIAFTYGPQGIRCNAVCPGDTETNIGATAAPTSDWAFERQLAGIALSPRKAQPDEIAAAISWLASSEASNVNGIAMSVDGGWKSA
jgi:NAD(P)-dependent dehydrogenase (short-subunit alcohol dehydrogenase family)